MTKQAITALLKGTLINLDNLAYCQGGVCFESEPHCVVLERLKMAWPIIKSSSLPSTLTAPIQRSCNQMVDYVFTLPNTLNIKTD